MTDVTTADYGTERTLGRDGCALRYWVRGADTAPMVVFTHGAGCDHRMFGPQMDAFAAEYRVVTHDVRAHGQSRPLTKPFDIQDAVADVVAILDDLGVRRAVLIGQSMGGNINQEVLFRNPERVAAIVSLGCACNTFSMTRMERWSAGPGMALLRAYPAKSLLRTIAKRTTSVPAVQEYVYEAESLLSKAEFLGIFGSLFTILHHEPDYAITIPELILRGDNDRLGNFRRVMPLWQERDPDSELVVVPNAGHAANMDNAEFFNSTVLEWLRRSLPSTGLAATTPSTAAAAASSA
jgi:3-oxoadipate enol-lactonase